MGDMGSAYPLAAKGKLRVPRLMQIDHYGDQLTGCVACNVWRGGDKSAFVVELAVEDWEALREIPEIL